MFSRALTDFATTCEACGGMECLDGNSYQFEQSEAAVKAITLLGETVTFTPPLHNRRVTLHRAKDCRLVVLVARERYDPSPDGWLPCKGFGFGPSWGRIFDLLIPRPPFVPPCAIRFVASKYQYQKEDGSWSGGYTWNMMRCVLHSLGCRGHIRELLNNAKAKALLAE